MCNLTRSPIDSNTELIKLIDAKFLDLFPEERPRMVNAFGRPMLPIILADGTVVPASWTYMPPAPPERKAEDGWRKLTYNCIGEEMFEKRTFADAAKKRRCLVPVEGYYEYQHRGKVKVPYWLHRPGAGLMLLGGLWKFYEDEGVYRFTVCTMPPNRLTAWVHNSRPRQPLEIPMDRRQAWLEGTDAASVAPFLVPSDDDGITAEETEGINGERVSNPPPEPPRESPGGQGELF